MDCSLDVIVTHPPLPFIQEPDYVIYGDYLVFVDALNKNGISSKYLHPSFFKRWVINRPWKIDKKGFYHLRDRRWRYIKSRIKKYSPKFVIINVEWEYSVKPSLIMTKIIKNIFNDTKVILTGNVPIHIKDQLRNVGVDYVFDKYKENEIINLIRNRLKTKTKRYMFSIKDARPMNKHELVIDSEIMAPITFGDILVSRGCPYRCSFCVYGRRSEYEIRQAEYVVLDILKTIHDHGTRDFVLSASSFLHSPSQAKRIMNLLIEKKVAISYHCYVNSNEITQELARLMKKSGCKSVSIGIESGSKKILKLMNKPSTIEINMKALEILKHVGIKTFASFIAGYPGETYKDLRDTFMFIKRNKIKNFDIGVIVPRLGTEVYNMIRDLVETRDLSDFDEFKRNSDMVFEKKSDEYKILLDKLRNISNHSKFTFKIKSLTNISYITTKLLEKTHQFIS